MTVWNVWSDGSCMHGVANAPRGVGGWGGWAAVVHHGSDGYTLHGRVPDTTNTRMELRAAIEGLRSVPPGERVILHTDCTTILSVHFAWRDSDLAAFRGPDARFWLELDGEFERRDVGVRLILRGEVDDVHKKAHVLAGAEARGGLRDLPPHTVPVEVDQHQLRKHLRATGRRGYLVHSRECAPGRCVASCPVWLEYGAAVYTSRRRSERRRAV